MKKIYRYLIWFFMLTKRLLLQRSFIILLLIIPCSIFLLKMVTSQESGIVHIMLCNEGNDEIATGVVKRLIEEDSVIKFSVCDSSDAARDSVIYNKADAAWIFSSDFSDKANEFISHNNFDEPFIKIIERESTTTLRIAKEKLFGTLYRDFSYLIYENFVYSELVSQEKVTKDVVKEYYDSLQKGGQIVQIERLGEIKSDSNSNTNYLTAPIRGILSLMVLLCTLDATLYFLKEQAQGKFSWLPVNKRIVPAFASCFSAALLSSTAMFITIQFTGMSTKNLNEICALFLYCASLAGFCVIISLFFRSVGKFGAIIPALLIIALALSPIFFNMKILRPVRLLLPTYYYLHSIYNSKYYLYILFYCIATYSFAIILNHFLSKYQNYNKAELK